MHTNISRHILALGLFYTYSCHALPFAVTPEPNIPFPTVMTAGTTAYASYTIKNNTLSQRNNNYLKYLPPNVSVLNSGCGAVFNLAPHGQPGDHCNLDLAISDQVNANDPNPSHHLFVCFPGGKSCAGTAYPLSISALTDAGYSGFSAIASLGNALYVGGVNSAHHGQLWELSNSLWSAPYTGFSSSPIDSIAAVNNTLMYFGGDLQNAGVDLLGAVYAFNPVTRTVADTGFTNTFHATDLVALTYAAGILYACGVDSSGLQGQVWSYINNTWNSTGLADNQVSTVLDIAYSTAHDRLFAAAIHHGTPTTGSYAQVLYYSGGSWTDSGLPTSSDSLYLVEVDALTIDSNGNVYAGGFDSNYNAAVWRYNGSSWDALPSPSLNGQVYDLAFNHQGILYAGGFDGTDFSGQVWFFKNGQWTSTQLMGSASVYEMVINANNVLYAAGLAPGGLSGIWSISANA